MSKTFVFKFGGASVKDADSIKNLSRILFNRLRNHTIIVISAMGKTTNALEEIIYKKMNGEAYSSNCTSLLAFHLDICEALFNPEHPIFSMVENYFSQLTRLLSTPINRDNYDESYDRIVPFGELISTRIVHEYLCQEGLLCIWQDAREIICTDATHRLATIDWSATQKRIEKQLVPKLDKLPVVTQGFIGANSKGKPTTLGREGSDFTAAILGHCLRATSVTVWKDVDGILNADPKRFQPTIKFEQLDYKEAAELTYYGASVIHPKTIKPLANLSTPLFVKSFLNPDGAGTKIHASDSYTSLPCIVVKDRQVLVSFKVTDFTFVNESHMHLIYGHLERLKLKVNMLQVSAISISIVTDTQPFKLEKLIENLGEEFEIRYNEDLHLITIKNQNEDLIEGLLNGKEILMEQMTRTTFQAVIKPTTHQQIYRLPDVR